MSGRELLSAVDIAFGCPLKQACSVNNYVAFTRERMCETYDMVREHTDRAAEITKRHYDAKFRQLNSKSVTLFGIFVPGFVRVPITSIQGSTPGHTR